MTDKITAREADWLCCVLETFTNTQDRKSDERIRQSAWEKLRKIRDSKRGQVDAADVVAAAIEREKESYHG